MEVGIAHHRLDSFRSRLLGELVSTDNGGAGPTVEADIPSKLDVTDRAGDPTRGKLTAELDHTLVLQVRGRGSCKGLPETGVLSILTVRVIGGGLLSLRVAINLDWVADVRVRGGECSQWGHSRGKASG